MSEQKTENWPALLRELCVHGVGPALAAVLTVGESRRAMGLDTETWVRSVALLERLVGLLTPTADWLTLSPDGQRLEVGPPGGPLTTNSKTVTIQAPLMHWCPDGKVAVCGGDKQYGWARDRERVTCKACLAATVPDAERVNAEQSVVEMRKGPDGQYVFHPDWVDTAEVTPADVEAWKRLASHQDGAGCFCPAGACICGANAIPCPLCKAEGVHHHPLCPNR